jgi:CubicO group peptidase (beta-lactamase class C family)
MKSLKLILAVLVVLSSCQNENVKLPIYKTIDKPTDESIYPTNTWTYTSPENFGYSLDKLKDVETAFKNMGGDAMFVIKNGYVIISWGDVSKPIQNRSIRKSYLNSLFGIEYDKGTISLDMTLAKLNIDDVQKLTEKEKQATVYSLLTSSSGVFHPAAYESKEDAEGRPPRGSFKTGEFFYYNNWDFNTLGHIYNKVTDKDIFESFKGSIANKIGMEDFKIENTTYEYEKSKSNYPAYRMRTSARDDARFGYLYLRKGKWENEQLLSEEWTSKSFEKHIATGEFYYYDYGFLWWIDTVNDMYIARGNSGQYIAIYPKDNMVFVFRADPGSIFKKWLGSRVKPQESFPLINMILSTRK